MTDLHKQIELLEARSTEAELLGALARDAETRAYNRQLGEELRQEAETIRRDLCKHPA